MAGRDIDEILREATSAAYDEFLSVYDGSGHNLTGTSHEQIAAQDNTIVAPVSVFTLIYGRKPGAWPPWGYEQGSETPTSLMQWCMDRLGASEKEAKSVSYLVARKLKEEGNRVYRGQDAPLDTTSPIDKASEVVFQAAADNVKKMIDEYTK